MKTVTETKNIKYMFKNTMDNLHMKLILKKTEIKQATFFRFQ